MIRPKNILTGCLVGCCITATTLTSCLKDQEDTFDRSASERLQDRIEQVRQVLRSAEHGWEFEYYPSSTLAYGGIVYTVRFDSLTATVGCSLVPDSTETTYYRITNDNGPVLTFDTYNRLLHYFSTPNGSEYEAKGGEFEFVVQDITDDQITLYGKKTRNTMYLRRLKDNADAYAEKTINIFDHFVSGFTGTIGAAEVEGTFELGSKTMRLISGTDTTTAHFTFNDKGIRLYRPIEVGDLKVQSLAFDTETSVFTILDEGAGSSTLQGIPFGSDVVPYNTYAGGYNFRYNNNGSSAAVRLEPNRLDGTYLLTGLSKHYNLVLNYDYATGHLTLGPQVVGDYNGRTVYFCTYSTSSGSIWLTDAASFTLKWNGSKTRVVYNFSATNPTRYNCNSAILVMVYYNDAGVLTAAQMSDSEWIPNNSALMQQLTSLQRQKD